MNVEKRSRSQRTTRWLLSRRITGRIAFVGGFVLTLKEHVEIRTYAPGLIQSMSSNLRKSRSKETTGMPFDLATAAR